MTFIPSSKILWESLCDFIFTIQNGIAVEKSSSFPTMIGAVRAHLVVTLAMDCSIEYLAGNHKSHPATTIIPQNMKVVALKCTATLYSVPQITNHQRILLANLNNEIHSTSDPSTSSGITAPADTQEALSTSALFPEAADTHFEIIANQEPSSVSGGTPVENMLSKQLEEAKISETETSVS
jgi:hypothetical protein